MNLITRKKGFKRILAMVLSVVMLVGVIQVNSFGNVRAESGTHLNVFTVTVTDKYTGEAISDANVTITSADNTTVYAGVTGNDGVAEITDISDYFLEGGSAFDATYKVTATGYTEVAPTEAISISEQYGNIAVEMSDTVAPSVKEVTGNSLDWTKDSLTLTVISDNADVKQYKYDGGEWQESAEFIVSLNGTYNFYAQDAAGNVSAAYEVVVSYIDTDAPVISSVTITPDTWTKEAVVVKVNATDAGSGVAEYKMDDNEWQTSNEFTISDNEVHKFYAKDTLGNETEVAFEASADKFDNAAPTISAVTPEEGWSNESITFTVVADDNKSGIAYYSMDDNSESAKWQEKAEFVIEDTEEHTFYVKDNAGNISEGFKAEKAKIEKEAPTIDKVTLSTEEWTNQAVTFTVVANDEEGGSGIAAYKMDDGEWQVSNESTYTFTVSDDEVHKFYVKDNADNISVAYEKAADNYDNVVPKITGVTTQSKGWMKKKVEVTVVATDDKSGVAYYSMDDTSDDAWKTTNKFEIKDKNKHTFYVKDNAGNVSNYDYSYEKYDTKAPTLNDVQFSQKNGDVFADVLNFLSFGRFFNKKLELTINAIDETDATNNASGVAEYIIYFYNANSELVYTRRQVVPNDEVVDTDEVENAQIFNINYSEVENFKGTIKVQIIDKVGVSTEEIQLTTGNSNLGEFDQFMVENDAPVIRGVEEYDGIIYSENYDFKFDVSDVQEEKEYSGIASVRVSVNGEEVYLQHENAESQKSEEKYSLSVDLDAKTVNGQQLENEWQKGVLTFAVEAYDNSGNVAESKTATMYIDQTAPVISGFKFSLSNNIDAEGSEGVYEAVDVADYGFYFKETVTVTITAKDVEGDNETRAAGVQFITYKAVNVDGETDYEGIDREVDSETNSVTFNIDKDFKGQIYAYATDEVDNAGEFVHPNGSVVETEKMHQETSSIEIVAPETEMAQNEVESYAYDGEGQTDKNMAYDTTQKVPLYNEAQTFEITVTDKYSGIRSVSVAIIENGVTKKDVLNISNDGKKLGDAAESWSVENKDDNSNLIYTATREIAVDGAYNNMVLLVELTDHAGNVSYDYYMFGIDKSAPIVTIEMNDNDNDKYEGFFKVDRTATITIQERNFVNDNVVFTVTATDENGVKKDLNITPKFVVATDENGNPKATSYEGEEVSGEYYTYTMDYTFTDDGDYTFDIKVTDLAARDNTSVSYVNANGEDIAEISTVFTIDKKLPVVTVSYDNNSAMNGNYYKADRTATITIAEHNFVAGDVVIVGTATDNGATSTFPTVSEWKNNGNNTYAATISYTADSKYSFDIEYVDKAGNSIQDYATEEFYVDKTAPNLSISGVADKSANNGDIIPVITYSDTNFDKDAVTIELSGINNGKVDYKGAYADITNGQTYTYANFEKIQKVDDIYTLATKLTDKAGNETTMTITFSANRFGSVYDLSDVKDIITKYLQAEQDIVFTETNVDSLEREGIVLKLTKNGTPTTLVEGTDYTVDVSGGNGQWSVYKYTVKKSLFKDDGRYSISIYSKDAAGNVNENIDESKEAEVSFGIDKTKPVVIPIDLESGKQYPVEGKKVTIDIKDNLVLENVKIYLNDKEIEYTVEGESYTFFIPESNSVQDVKVVAVDAAGNTYELNVEDFLVSTNIFVRWYNNTPLFIGSIVGVVLLAVGITIFILFGKKKKEEE